MYLRWEYYGFQLAPHTSWYLYLHVILIIIASFGILVITCYLYLYLYLYIYLWICKSSISFKKFSPSLIKDPCATWGFFCSWWILMSSKVRSLIALILAPHNHLLVFVPSCNFDYYTDIWHLWLFCLFVLGDRVSWPRLS